MQKIGLVISGGSSKGAYQIGFFKAFTKSGLAPAVNAVSATSIGVINTYAFLTGKLEQAEELWTNLAFNGIWNLRKKIKEENILYDSFSRLITSTDKIPCDFYITLSEMSTMTAQYFNLHGKVNAEQEKLLYATVSIPLLTAPPLQHNGKIYFDGGVTDNIPLTPLIHADLDTIFVVHFTPEYQVKEEKFKNDTQIININMSQCNHFIKGNFNFQKEQVRQMIDEGENYTRQTIDNYLLQHYDKKAAASHAGYDLYSYLSGARMLEVLNKALDIGKDKRAWCIEKIKQLFFPL